MKRADLFFTAALIPIDYFTLIVAACAAYSLRFWSVATDIRPVTFNLSFAGYLQIVAPIALVLIIVFAFSGLYAIKPRRMAVEMTKIIMAVSTGIAIILAIAFFSRELFDSRFIFVAAWLFAIILVASERTLVRAIQRSLYSAGVGTKYVIIIGKTRTGNALKKFFSKNSRLGYKVVQHFGVFSKDAQMQILNKKKKDRGDIILVADPDIDQKELDHIKAFSDIEHFTFIYSAEMFPGSAVTPIIHTFSGIPVIEVPKTPLDGWGSIYKRFFDICGALFLITITLPIQLLTAIVLLSEKQGGILFRQMRIGQRGRPFKYFKFRSMVKNAHKMRFDSAFIQKHGNERGDGPLFKLEDDPRVTRFGKFIRKLSIDELPEFYLVLIGRMSLVGPRPHLPQEVEKYEPNQKRVLNVKPGITGMAQISGRANLHFDEEIRLDMYYIENWSPWLDIVILLKTPLVVIFKTGAY
ncbi:sugar transferase [Patescibacteria group bacterium]|nr:sugar transferase [Patescibacteria group bacterium]